MTHTEKALGGRLALLSRDETGGEQRQLYDRMAEAVVPWADKAGFDVQADGGRFIGPFNALLRSPALAELVLGFQLDEMKRSSLAPRLREVVILTVGATWQPTYEIYAHSIAARTTGLSPEAIAALLRCERPAELTDDEAVARDVAQALSTRAPVDDALYADARDRFGEKGLVDIAVLVGNYCMVSSMLNLFEIGAPAD